MPPAKKNPNANKRPADSGGESGTATPNAASEDNEILDDMARFLLGISIPDHRENVAAIIDQTNLDIETKLTYLEDYLTVGQVRTCKKLLQEKDSNFKQYCQPGQIKLIERMLTKEDYNSIRAIVVGLNNAQALSAFQNYLKFNEITEPEDEKLRPGKDDKKPKPPPKKPDSEESEEGEEVSSVSDEDEEEPEPPKPKPTPKEKKEERKKARKNKPDPSSYDEWQKQKKEPAFKDTEISPTQIWELAEKATEMRTELEQKARELSAANAEMKMKIKDMEEMHKTEKEGLKKMHESKMQEASRKHLDDVREKDREIAALRQTQQDPTLAPAQTSE